MSDKLYAHRDPVALGQHYTNHVLAMTAESLRSKADIAAELAWRDAEIERLRAEAEALATVRQEHTAVTDLLTADDALCRLGFVEAFEVLKARVDEAVYGDGGTYDKVEHSLLTALGFPTETLDEAVAEVRRLRAQLAAPLRLGRGPVDVDEAWASLPASVTSAAIAAVAEAVGGDAYDCARVWSAWSHGTMGEDDFLPVIGDSDRVAQIAREVTVAVLAAADQALDPNGQPCPVGGWGETP